MTWPARGWRFVEEHGRPGYVGAALLSVWLALGASTARGQGPAPSATTPIFELPPLRPVPSPPAYLAVPATRPVKPPTIVQFSRGAVVQASHTTSPAVAPPAAQTLPVVAAPSAKVVPISFDAVLRLARDQNGQIHLAREKLNEAFAEQELAGKRWLPDLYMGMGMWRHEGGIQDFQGNMVRSSYGGGLMGVEVRGKMDLRDVIFTRLEAERKVWQQQGELARFTSDQLLDAATTYVELLAARSAEAIGQEAEAKLQRLLVQAKNLEKVDGGVRVEVARVEAELGAQQILTRRLREGASAAVAKLIYLLGLDPASELAIQERQLVPFTLVPAQPDAKAMVDTALLKGPGVNEVQVILGVLETMRAKSNSPLHWLPTVEMNMGEGAFAATPGPRTDWENRWDLGVQARWNVTELLTGRERKRLVDLKIQQAYLGYHDLRGKLTLGVQEACEAIRSSQEQLTMATRQIQHAEESYNLSDMRLRENIKGRSPSEVLLAVRSLVGGRLAYLHALREHNKAQIRLFVLTGGAALCATSR